MDNKNNTSLYEHTEEFPFPAMEPDKDEMFINIRNIKILSNLFLVTKKN